jgi:hypothetical protein
LGFVLQTRARALLCKKQTTRVSSRRLLDGFEKFGPCSNHGPRKTSTPIRSRVSTASHNGFSWLNCPNYFFPSSRVSFFSYIEIDDGVHPGTLFNTVLDGIDTLSADPYSRDFPDFRHEQSKNPLSTLPIHTDGARQPGYAKLSL